MNQGDKAIAQVMGYKYQSPVLVEVDYEYKPIAEGKNVEEKNGVVVRTSEMEYWSTDSFGRGSKRTGKRDIIIEPIKGVFKFYYADPDETNEDREKYMIRNLHVDHYLDLYRKQNGVPFEFIVKGHKKNKY